MSYRNPDQALEGPCKKIIEGIDDFNKAANARVDSGDWTDEHLGELADIQERLVSLRLDIANLLRRNW